MSSNSNNDNGNGNRDPLQFPKASLPIVGQPFTMKAWLLTVSIVCNCDAKEPVLLVGQLVAQCRACGRQFQHQGLRAGPNGEVSHAIGIISTANEQTGAQPS